MEGGVWIRSKKRMRHALPRAALGFLFLGQQPGDAFLYPGLRRYAAKGAMGHMSAGGLGARQRRSRSPILGAPMMAEGNGPNGGMPSDGMKIPPSLLDEARKSDEGLLPGEGPFPAPDPKLLDKRARKEAVRKTEMWKDLWMRNVASNAADAGHHTFNFMNSGFSSVSSTFQPIMSSITNKLNIFDWEWKMGPDHYEEVLNPAPPFVRKMMAVNPAPCCHEYWGNFRGPGHSARRRPPFVAPLHPQRPQRVQNAWAARPLVIIPIFEPLPNSLSPPPPPPLPQWPRFILTVRWLILSAPSKIAGPHRQHRLRF
jgi:hypothetical protein